MNTTNTPPSTHEQANNKSELWNLSIRDLFYKYIRFLPLFILSVAFALLVAFLYLRYSIPVYSVSGSMIIRSEQQSSSNDELADLMGNNKASNIANEIEILKSNPLMLRVVDSLDLQVDYSARGRFKSENVYKHGAFLLKPLQIFDTTRSFPIKIKFINDHQFTVNDDKAPVMTFGSVFRTPNGIFMLTRNPGPVSKDYKVTWTPSSSAAGVFASGIQVVPKIAGTGILNISMRTTNPQMGADIINSLMEEYGRYSIEQKNKTSVQTVDFIEARLKEFQRKIDSIQSLLNVYEQQHNLINPEIQTESYFGDIKESDKTINDQTLKLNIVDMLNDYLNSPKNQFSKVPSLLNLDDVTLGLLVNEYNAAQIERQGLLDANLPVNNPLVKGATDRIEKLRTSIRETMKNMRSSLTSVINKLESQRHSNQSELRNLPVKVKEQMQIQRQVDALQGLNKFLQEEKERQAIKKASNVSNSDVINKAYPTSIPVKPNKRAIRMLAIFLGLGLPALIIFINEVLNDKVSTRFDIEKLTKTPILGEIGHSYSDKVLVVNKTTRSMVAEQFRIIRSNLQYVLNKKQKSVILFTSSFSGEGKSYVTTNMGAVLALAGKKTIILEFDIRKPKILSGLGMPKGPGITNYLISKAELPDLVKPIPEHENLFVLGCGPIPPNPSELLLDNKVEELFIWLRENFDMILVDTAPVGMVSDAMTLSKFVDSTLYLVRQGHTFKKQVALIDEFYQEDKLPKVSIIINDVKIKAGYGYYGYGRYGYGYGYGYGSYYEEEVPPRNMVEKVIAWLDIRRFFGKPKKKKKNR